MCRVESMQGHKGSSCAHQVHRQNVSISNKTVTKHNDSNVVIIGTDCISDNLAGYLVECYLLNGFDNGEKNKIRIQIMKDLEEKYLTK